MLEVDGLSVRYGAISAVRGASFSCRPGEIVTIVGPNGAGKSSILNALSGAAPASIEGRASLDGVSLVNAAPEDTVARGLALVPEGRRIFMTLTVRENLALGATTQSSTAERRKAVEEVVERFPALQTRMGQTAGTMSGGEQQQLAIARALASRPRLMMLDEPSLGLAPMMVDEVFSIIEGLRADGVGVLLVEQHVRRAMALADRCYMMQNARLSPAAKDSERAQILDAYLGGVERD